MMLLHGVLTSGAGLILALAVSRPNQRGLRTSQTQGKITVRFTTLTQHVEQLILSQEITTRKRAPTRIPKQSAKLSRTMMTPQHATGIRRASASAKSWKVSAD